ncbi:hypothetical protein [Halobaculum marinum]|uniref:DUF5658 domain-containing protein n=1 Tax=Halobaculum marinum TaxID=3031996 RepID=A0ABD5WYQ1_9EURY|nr:hypothetical protein [Halobaculum sp. DT55]
MPTERHATIADRVEEYWAWAAGALFLLVTVDLLTTMYAAAAVGRAAEANPLVRWALGHPLPVLVALNLAAVVLAAVVFHGVFETYRVTSPRVRPYYGLVIETWLGLLLAAGLAIYANNLTVIVLGASLL